MNLNTTPLIEQLIVSLRCLPGVGPRTAQRMAFYLLARDRPGGKKLAALLQNSMDAIIHCYQCRGFSETTHCHICTNPQRHNTILCVLESPADLLAIEKTGYQGLYFVLHGHLSPIDGIGPHELGLEQLQQRLNNEKIEELILATNPTVEGQATAHYIADLAKPSSIKISQIALGVPFGSELEWIDGNTLSHAFNARETVT
jgi:recombination protein RecR